MSFIEQAATANAVCDYPTPLTDFDGAAYMGTWYEQDHVMHQFFQPDTNGCVQAQYGNLQSDGHFTVYNTMQTADFGPRTGIEGTGYCPDASGHCYVHFYGNEDPKRPNYQVVDTDYTSYSIVYACGSLKEFLWLLTREPVVSEELYLFMVEEARAALPHFNWNNMAPRDYQGPLCTYSNSIPEIFLQ